LNSQSSANAVLPAGDGARAAAVRATFALHLCSRAPSADTHGVPRADHDRPPYRLAITLAGYGVLATALAVILVGWVLDVAAVRSVIPGAVAMKPHTAAALGLGAVAMLLLGPPARGRRRWVGLTLASIPGLLALAVLSEYVFGIRLGIDEIPFIDHDGRAAGIAFPGRFAPTTGVCFLLLTGALLSLDRGTSWRWRPSELFAIPMGIVALMSLIGYAYAIPAFYGPVPVTKMAVNTSVCFVALATALLIARPRGRFFKLADTMDPGGVMVRRMVPLCVVVPLVLGWLHLRTVEWGMFDDEVGSWWLAAATIAGLVAMVWWCASTLSAADRERCTLEAQLFELANRDALTGLFNRRRFEEEFDHFLARARRYGDTGTLLLLDLDRLKPTNDTLGHEGGDLLLRAVAGVLTALVRESDVVGRIGGDEFAVLLLGASPVNSLAKADDLRVAIADVRIETQAGSAWTSVSIGVAAVQATDGLDSSEILKRADVAMYRAKRAGGNQVALAGLPADVAA
jgi:diguanylate cyclase (GGDEF)-like protein